MKLSSRGARREKLTLWLTFVRLDLFIVRQIWRSNHVGLIFFLRVVLLQKLMYRIRVISQF